MNSNPPAKRLLETLGSKQLGIFIFTTLAIYSIMLTAWGLTSSAPIVYALGTNPAMKLLLFLLVVNNGAFIINYLSTVKALTKAEPVQVGIDTIKKRRFYNLYETDGRPADVAAALGARFKRRGYKLGYGREGLSFVAVKGRQTAWATILFHGSLLLIAISLMISPFTSIEEKAIVTEGQTFDSRNSQVFAAYPPEKKHQLPPFGFTVEKIVPDIWTKGVLFKSLYARVKTNMGVKHQIRCSVAWKPDWATYVTLETVGYAPKYVLRDKDGQVLDYAYVNLNTMPSGKEDSFKIKGLDHNIYVKVLPNYHIKKGRVFNKDSNLRRPGLFIRVMEGKKERGNGFVRMGQSVPLGPYALSFEDVRYWGEFEFTHNPLLMLVWAGFFGSCLAVAWRVFVYKREIIVAMEEDGGRTLVHIASKSDYGPHAFADKLDRSIRSKYGFSRIPEDMQ